MINTLLFLPTMISDQPEHLTTLVFHNFSLYLMSGRPIGHMEREQGNDVTQGQIAFQLYPVIDAVGKWR